MILDTLPQSARYREMDPRLRRALAWLETFSPERPDGRCDIDGDDVFALVQSYVTVNAAEKKFESHRLYADVQYVARGSEVIPYAPVATLRPDGAYHAEKDYVLYAEPPVSTPLRLQAGSFAVFYPQDGHKPGCGEGTFGPVKKVVVKIRL